MTASRRPAIFWSWFAGAYLVLVCLASVFIWKAMQPAGRPSELVPVEK